MSVWRELKVAEMLDMSGKLTTTNKALPVCSWLSFCFQSKAV